MSHYVGSEGDAYFAHREPLRRPEVQRRQSDAFARYVAEGSTVLDFGCGTGDILAGLGCKTKVGIEVNEPSVRRARENGLTVYNCLDAIASDSIDALIANHSLEHVRDPAAMIDAFHRVLKNDGVLLVVVPAEEPRSARFRSWHEEMNKHMFSWTPLSLGNLIIDCGFCLEQSSIRSPARAGRYTDLLKIFGPAHRAVLYIRWLLTDDYEIFCAARAVKSDFDDQTAEDLANTRAGAV